MDKFGLCLSRLRSNSDEWILELERDRSLNDHFFLTNIGTNETVLVDRDVAKYLLETVPMLQSFDHGFNADGLYYEAWVYPENIPEQHEGSKP